jgi:acyl-[acyl-carrier-protein]-phospholipid O-acyltransferase/long-chain-fatty-acid--[acyl-carrier-protein] ligase
MRFFSSFASLNITQFLTALNDNLYKLLLVFFLISLKGAEHSNTILSLAGAIFVIPFLLFASLAGTLADRLSKRSIIYFTRITEILTTSLGVVAFLFRSVWGGYAVLFLMALQSTLFSPCKYGIIPEIVPKAKISHCNGVITATTYLAIILGTFLASFVTEITRQKFVVAGLTCVIVAILGLIMSCGIEKTRPQAETKKVSARFISDIFRTLKRAKQKRYLLPTLIFGSYFLFMGSYTQLNIIPFTIQSLHLSEVHGGYLFLMTAIGIGLGSYVAGEISGKEVELGFIPLAAFCMMLCFLFLYFFQYHFFVVVPFLILLGFFGGFYTVPIEAYIQVASPDEDRGQNVAAGNFLSFIGVILASGLLALLGNVFSLTAAQGFYVMGWITLVISIALVILVADQLLRLGISMWARLFLKIQVWGKNRILQSKTPLLLIAPRLSWLDTLIVMAVLPRMIRYIVPVAVSKQKYRFLYKLLHFIPLDIEHFSPIGSRTLSAVRKELVSGNSVCLMHPIDLPPATLHDWENALAQLLQNINATVMPIHIARVIASSPKNPLSQLFSLHSSPIKLSYGSPKNHSR